MSEQIIEWNHFEADALNGKLESEARKLECRVGTSGRYATTDAEGRLVPLHGGMCSASACAHWRWLHRGGTRYERHSFQSELPVPEGAKPPSDVPEGWEFEGWDTNVLSLKKNGHQPLTPRFWARRPIEILLPRGLCGLAHD